MELPHYLIGEEVAQHADREKILRPHCSAGWTRQGRQSWNSWRSRHPALDASGVICGAKGPPFRLHRRACKEPRHVSGTADLRAGAAEAVSPAANAVSSLAQHSWCGRLRRIVEATLRRSGKWAGLDAAETGKRAGTARIDIVSTRRHGAARCRMRMAFWASAAAGWGMENGRDDRVQAVFLQRQRAATAHFQRGAAPGSSLNPSIFSTVIHDFMNTEARTL